MELPLCSMIITTYWELGQVPSCWSRVLKFESELAQFPLSVCLSSSQHWHSLPREQKHWSKKGWCVFSVRIMTFWLPSEICSASDALPVHLPVMAAPSLLRHFLEFEPPQHLMVKLFPWSSQSLLLGGASVLGKLCWSFFLAQGVACACMVTGNQ